MPTVNNFVNDFNTKVKEANSTNVNERFAGLSKNNPYYNMTNEQISNLQKRLFGMFKTYAGFRQTEEEIYRKAMEWEANRPRTQLEEMTSANNEFGINSNLTGLTAQPYETEGMTPEIGSISGTNTESLENSLNIVTQSLVGGLSMIKEVQGIKGLNRQQDLELFNASGGIENLKSSWIKSLADLKQNGNSQDWTRIINQMNDSFWKDRLGMYKDKKFKKSIERDFKDWLKSASYELDTLKYMKEKNELYADPYTEASVKLIGQMAQIRRVILETEEETKKYRNKADKYKAHTDMVVEGHKDYLKTGTENNEAQTAQDLEQQLNNEREENRLKGNKTTYEEKKLEILNKKLDENKLNIEQLNKRLAKAFRDGNIAEILYLSSLMDTLTRIINNETTGSAEFGTGVMKDAISGALDIGKMIF